MLTVFAATDGRVFGGTGCDLSVEFAVDHDHQRILPPAARLAFGWHMFAGHFDQVGAGHAPTPAKYAVVG